jgi:hypothetical protein
LKSEILAPINSGYWKIKASDVKAAVKNSADVLAFTKSMQQPSRVLTST